MPAQHLGSAKWRRFRKRYLDANPFCASCSTPEHLVGAQELDHIVPRWRAPGRVYDVTNVQGLCRPCHQRKSDGEKRRTRAHIVTLEGDIVPNPDIEVPYVARR